MNLYNRVLNKLEKRKEIIETGGINCIPSPFTRYRNTFIGIEQGCYTVVTAATKGYKSQFSSFLFIYNSVLYAYKNNNKIAVNILYFPLEETPETVIERYICYLLYTLSDKSIRNNPKDLKSTNENKPLPNNILELLKTDEYKNILEYFLKCVHFHTETNPPGILNVCKEFIQERGETIYKDVPIKDSFTGISKIVKGFDYFKPHNPNEYNMIYIDHISLISTEKGLTLRESINRLSEYLVTLRNRYNFNPVVIQQQVFNETIDAFKENKLKPTVTGLADSKYTARDANLVLSLFTPFNYELREYMGYDITKFRKNITFLEVLVNRDGESNNIAPLYVDGSVTYFNELPLPTDKEAIDKVYNFITKTKQLTSNVTFFTWTFNKLNKIFKNG